MKLHVNKEEQIESNSSSVKQKIKVMLGASFLMATSAIGPGTVTQVAVFTESLLTSFSFVILISAFLNIGAQVNIWRIISIAKLKGQDIANAVFPGLGYFITSLIILGGIAFNMGNLAGAGLGLNALTGIDANIGSAITALLCIFIFLSKEAGFAMDFVVRWLGLLMIVLTGYIVIVSDPPIAEATLRTFVPLELSFYSIITIVGGTVGGFITFAGAHRLLDAGISGPENLSRVTKSSVFGISVTAIMHILLYLAVLGVVSKGFSLDPSNPTASAFFYAAGEIGYRLFGLVLWAAGITSAIGASYTTISFFTTFHLKLSKYRKLWIIIFLIFTCSVLISIGRPVLLLILASSFNGLILPITLASILLAAHNKRIIGDYKHPIWLTIFGVIVVILTTYFGVNTLIETLPQLF
ncbi:NRAMP family divalent metal transporter [Paraliobacillus sp. PM-2]|uniref:NRAMP family divalent metal transporter n=1 Tax=Paraliobacillus sp. PM-2 TaxID=1462524 RepID=UPI000B822858|nr:NRAMP family divalent metal transporter [Paraliobacillus sp. PM-2]